MRYGKVDCQKEHFKNYKISISYGMLKRYLVRLVSELQYFYGK